MKQSMIFYASWKEAIKGLPDGVRLEVYEAAVDFAMTGNVPELSAMAAMVFPFIRQDIERDSESYDKLCEMRRKIGKLGGAPKGNQNARKNNQNNQVVEITTKTTKASENNQNNLNDITTSSNSLSKEKNSLQSSKRKSAEADPIAAGKEEKADAPDFRKLADFFNDELRRNGSIIPTIRSIDGQRRSGTMARIREHGKPAFAEAVKKAAASDFLNGKNDRGWVADFDWIIKPNNFIKVLEGNYDNRQQNNQRYGNTGKHNQRGKGGNPEDGYESSL
jgi:hypothetical protein